MPKSKGGFYAVHRGHKPGVYTTWDECKAQVDNWPGAKHKKFANAQDAMNFSKYGDNPPPAAAAAPSRTYLNNSFAEKDAVKALGAQFDGTAKRWYVPPGADRAPFARWLGSSSGASSSRSGASSSSSGASSSVSPPGELAIFTDGACKGNMNVHIHKPPAGWGIVAVEAQGHPNERAIAEHCGLVVLDAASPHFLGAEVGSNNTGELCAICEALTWLRWRAPSGAAAAIHYDSEYAANMTTGKWGNPPTKNAALVYRARELLAAARAAGHAVRFVHVKGHAGHKWNERADALATEGLTRQAFPPRGAGPPGVDETDGAVVGAAAAAAASGPPPEYIVPGATLTRPPGDTLPRKRPLGE